MAEHHISLPLTDPMVEQLRAGDSVRLSGVVYAARDAAHRRFVEALGRDEHLPVDLDGQVIYYVGPTPARPGRVIGAAGPTTAMRLDPFLPRLLEIGLKGTVGKGGRTPAAREAIRRHHAVYFQAIGGLGALLARHITAVEVVAYEDLGTESVKRMVLEDFPCFVCVDAHGGYLPEVGRSRWRDPAVLGDYLSSTTETYGG